MVAFSERRPLGTHLLYRPLSIAFFALQMLAQLTDSQTDNAHPSTTSLLIEYFNKYQEQLFGHAYYSCCNSEYSYYNSEQPQRQEWVIHALCNLSSNDSNMSWIVDCEAMIAFLVRALSEYETLESVHAAHTLANIAQVQQHRAIVLKAGVNSALSQFLMECDASIAFYCAFPEHYDEDTDEDEHYNCAFQIVAFLREYERVKPHITQIMERTQ